MRDTGPVGLAALARRRAGGREDGAAEHREKGRGEQGAKVTHAVAIDRRPLGQECSARALDEEGTAGAPRRGLPTKSDAAESSAYR
jgi:hypothetical protein